MKILTVIGARPQFIKAAVVSRALKEIVGLSEILVHTGQHYDDKLSSVFFEELEITEPSYNLAVGSGPHGYQTGRMLEKLEKIMIDIEPDQVLVYGDTNSTLAGALAAVKLNLPLSHVEAGLRSFNRTMPEEINRILTDHSADLLFAPTDLAIKNLKHEGIAQSKVHLVGDVMYDAALYYGSKAAGISSLLKEYDLSSGNYILATIHRAENTDSRIRLAAIIEGLSMVAKEIQVVFPVHPRTRKKLIEGEMLEGIGGKFKLLQPLGYLDMVMAEKNAQLIVTDSGGVQKESFFYDIPCVTLREETEWLELVELGWNKLCPPFSSKIVYSAIMDSIGTKGHKSNLYGDGKAAEKISLIITKQ